jgi:hypothetical protein
MKKFSFTYFLLTALLSITGNLAQARILRVNNTGIPLTPLAPNTLPIYTTAQAAHDAAVNGDTIHIEPSGVDYGNLTVTKQVIIIGNGYFLGPATSNFNPNLQAIPNTSKLAAVSFNAGSSNSAIMGISILSNLTLAGDNSSLNNITVKRNNISQFFYVYGTVNNSKIIQNYFDGYGLAYANGAFTNFLFSNNIMNGAIQFDANDNGVVENNVLNVSGSYGLTIQNSTIRNNIDGTNTATGTFTGSMVQNNMSVSTVFGNLDGNIQNANLTNVFEDWANTSSSFSIDSRLQLKTGSPAIGAGFGGINMGAYGGSFPYVLSGIPNVPSIFKLNTPSVVTSSSMSVTISTRSNN